MMIERIRSALVEVADHYDDQRWWKRRITDRLIGSVHAVYPGFGTAVRIPAADWDNLIVLDGCRYDLFEETVDIDRFDSYGRIESLGSATPEWTRRNFGGGSFGDTVYVTANPQTSKHAGNSFHRIIAVWEDHFDDEVGTVFPGAVLNAALAASESYPNKRLIVHFMQPHHPFVGEQSLNFGGVYDPDAIVGDVDVAAQREGIYSPWQALEAGVVDLETVWRAYRSNLELVMEPVWDLLEAIEGRTVVTSDHGNLVGERGWPVPMKLYGHRAGVRLPGVVRVPWAVSAGDRRRIIQEETAAEPVDEDQLESRLEELGYR
jgi:hypothetical protein